MMLKIVVLYMNYILSLIDNKPIMDYAVPCIKIHKMVK